MQRLRHRLLSEMARHLLAGVIPIALIVVASIFAIANDRSDAIMPTVTAFVFAGFGVYGPVYLLLTVVAFHGIRGRRLRAALLRSEPEHERTVQLLVTGNGPIWGVLVSIMAISAVLTLAVSADLRDQPSAILGAIACVIGSWVLLAGVFTTEYARLWARTASIEFPGDDDDRRMLGDFAYLSFQVSTTFSSSDVSMLSTRARASVTTQSIAAFAFNTVIVALLVSLLLAQVA